MLNVNMSVASAATTAFTCMAIAPEWTDACNRLQIVAEAFTLRKRCHDSLPFLRSHLRRRW